MMSDTRLNGIIRAWEQGKPAYMAFAKLDKQTAIEMSDAPYDGIVYEMEHNPTMSARWATRCNTC
jgi:4-hydroxy-2-oxoheptanedioate aldolase